MTNVINVIIARYGEIHLKGHNRGLFVDVLTKNLQSAVGQTCQIKFENSRYIFSDFNKGTENTLIQKISKVFGIVSVSLCACVPHDQILTHLKTIKVIGTFKTAVNRADKSFPTTSMDFAPIAGGVISENNPTAKVDVINPETIINIDIREQNKAYIYDSITNAVGGMPVGTAGKGLSLLSGGIDSPAASYLGAKRGLEIDFLHFESPPYTSEHALDKIRRLAKTLRGYTGNSRIWVVPFTEIQERIRKCCDPNYLITIMRRFMLRIARALSQTHNYDCIITGENLAQVASQTIQGITTNNICAGEIPVLRPLITYDKSEIVTLAKKIGTYDISIEPHADCCTVFVPDKPVIKPTIKKCETEETKLDTETLVARAIERIYILE